MESIFEKIAVTADIVGLIAGGFGIWLGIKELKDIWSSRGDKNGGEDNQTEGEESEQENDPRSDADSSRSDSSDK